MANCVVLLSSLCLYFMSLSLLPLPVLSRPTHPLPWSILSPEDLLPESSASPSPSPPPPLRLWPLPHTLTRGASSIRVRRPLRFHVNGPAVHSLVLREAVRRTTDLIFLHARSRGAKGGEGGGEEKRESGGEEREELAEVIVSVDSDCETLQLETDESYRLEIPSNGSAARVHAPTVYGAVHALQTFSQLCSYDWRVKAVQIKETPWSIKDKPRFAHRGLLIDSARHYEPIRVLRQILDSMAAAKLNVLHWHIVDDQSFPLEIPSFPRLWRGAYSEGERITMEDAKDLVEYARLRGIKIMAELDVPGHTRCWGIGYPELWPSTSCQSLLDVSKNFTFQLIQGILEDFSSVFPYRLLHLGGDEVDTACWTETPRVREWLSSQGWSARQAYAEFVLNVISMAQDRGWHPVNWEEPFHIFGDRLPPNSIVHNWIQGGVAPQIVAAGHRCLVSNQDVWYLDHLEVQWDKFYNNEPLAGIEDPEEQKLVLGGEVCMWGETADPSDVLQTIWPRAAAAAERLWSPRDVVENGDRGEVEERLEWFRCLLHERGVPAAPVQNIFARTAPPRPGSCFEQ